MKRDIKLKIKYHLYSYLSYMEQREFDLQEAGEDTEELNNEIVEIRELIQIINKEVNK